MGMAASQARFLGLTARKSNVEFEGQQVNQQRTTLGNQTANYYTQLLGLQVPTPPSVDQFTKTAYSWQQGSEPVKTISQVTMADDGTYNVLYTQQEMDTVAQQIGFRNVTSTGGVYRVGGAELVETDQNDLNALAKINARYNFPTDTEYYKFVVNGDTTYLTKAEAQNAAANNQQSQTYQMQSVETQKQYELTGANITWDASGRMISMSLGAGQPDISLSVSTQQDGPAYDDAMNQYEYNKAQYDKEIENINAKITIVQQQDKNLELRLKQLDTEQEAIQTEMDAVQKVIQKNTESTFKTFA